LETSLSESAIAIDAKKAAPSVTNKLLWASNHFYHYHTKAKDQLTIVKRDSCTITTMKNTATDKKTDHSTDSTQANPQEEAQSKQQSSGAPTGGSASTLPSVAPGGRVEVDFSAVTLKNGKKLCCKNNEELNLKLCSENTTLENQLKKLSKHFEEKEMEFESKSQSYRSSMSEMRELLTRQKRLGDQCKNEMDILTKKFEDKIRNFKCKSDDMKEENSELHKENHSLRGEIQRLRNELEDKTVEAYEAKEMNGIYSAKLTKLDRKFKKLKDEDEESYMEMTF